MRVDTVYAGGVILPGGGRMPVDRLAVAGSTIVATGKDCDGLTARKHIDLGGRWVVAGFHDAHNHLAWFGLTLDDLDLSTPPMHSVADIYELVASAAAERPPGSWIKGAGYDDNKLAGGHPHRDALDRVAPDNPVWLRHRSGHMAVVNSHVLNRLGRDVPAGGDIDLDNHGRPTGLLVEQAQLLLQPLIYPVPLADLLRAIDRASSLLLAEGITSVQEAGVGAGLLGSSPVEIAAYQTARDGGQLKVRTVLMVALENLHQAGCGVGPEGFGLDLGIRSGFGDDWLRLGPVKIWADGSLIGRTAAMSAPYENEAANSGFFQLDVPSLRAAIRNVHRSGWQIATHAIGDLAVHEVLNAYADALAESPRTDCRHRIEHCGVIRPDDVPRLRELGVIPVPQGRFINELGDGMLAALGRERINWCYRQRSFLNVGVPLPASSDRPVVNGAPLLGMADLVHRRTASGAVLAPHERITPQQALRAYTFGSAYAAFRENRVGALTPGHLADFVVLSGDPRQRLGEHSPDLEIVATAVGGALAYDPEGIAA